jgi:hypothetical protein
MRVASIPTIFIIILLVIGEAIAQQSGGERPRPGRPFSGGVPNCDCFAQPGDFIPKMSGSDCVFSYCDTSSQQCIATHFLRLQANLAGVVNPTFGVRSEVKIPNFWCDPTFWKDVWEAADSEGKGENPNR